MRTRALTLLLALTFVAALPVAAAPPGTPGVPGTTVVPRRFEVRSLPRATPFVGPVQEIAEGEVPMGNAAFEAFKKSAPRVLASQLTHVTIDPSAGTSGPGPLAPTAGTGFEGILQNGFIPGEPCVAAGPLNIFTTGNVTVTITDKDGSNRVEINGDTFFGAPTGEGAISDAVCYYDALRGRFLALCFTEGTAGSTKWSNFYLAISQTNDARGAWYLYKFDQRFDGTTLTSNWSDFEGLGVSDDKIAMSSQQFSFGANLYKYQKVRVIDRAIAYTGAPVTFMDLVSFPAPPGGDVNDLFVTKVGRNLTAGDNTIYCLNVRYNGGSRVTYRTVTGPPGAPVISAGQIVPVNTYSAPVGAPQSGSSGLVATNDCRLGAFYVRSGVLLASWHFGINFGDGNVDAVRLFRLRTSDQSVLTDETFGADGVFYYYPAATVDSLGAIFLGFDRSNLTEFSSSWATGKRRSDATLEPSALLKAGISGTSQSRWGDYTGIDMDAAASGPSGSTAWYAGQRVKGTNTFGTWITPLTFSYGTIAGTVQDDCDGSTGTTGDRVPLAGATVTLKQGVNTVGTTTTDVSGAYLFGYLEAGTYDVVVTPPAGGGSVDAIPGSGATSQTRISASDIQVALTVTQASAANQFLVTTVHGAPATTSIAPATKNQGDPGFAMTVNGSGFLACSIVRLDGSDRTTAYVSGGQLTATIPASDMASGGTHTITVFTPAAGGGTSNGQTFTVNTGDGTPPTVTVNAPNGGETWKAGSSHAITWTANDNVGVTAIDIAWSSDGGATYPNAIATGIANSGTYAWSVPNAPTTTARVRVTAHDAATNTGADASDANFTIDRWTITASAGAHGTIVPVGAVPVVEGAGQGFTITADTGYGIADVLVDGSSVGAVASYTFNTVNANHTIAASFAANIYPLTTTSIGVGSIGRNPNAASYAYGTNVDLTATAGAGWAFSAWSGDATGNVNPVTVTMNAAKSVTATFLDVAPPLVTVSAPNGGEDVPVANHFNVQWTATDNVVVALVHLLLSRTGLGGPYDTVAARIANSGSYDWTANGPTTSNAVFRVVAIDSAGNPGEDHSDAPFAITDQVAAADLTPITEFAVVVAGANPGHGPVTIEFSVPAEAAVVVSVLDVTGREVSRLADGVHPRGRFRATWDGRGAGGAVRSGLYFVRLHWPGGTKVRRVAITR
ncbi:MAG: hypothetical protein HYR74_03990 [Candidatus Eisenbacteria bacterium]|nr:hypothetical protein [Candidatus Eisenbacteria bacterium]